MVDPPRELALTVSRSLEGQQRGARFPVPIDSSYSSPQVLAPFHHGAPCPVLSFPSESSQPRPPGSHRRLPIPPVHVSRSPSASTSSTSSSSLSLPSQLPTSRRHSYRPLPKRPEYPPDLVEPRKGRASIDGRSPPMTPATAFVPQHPTNVEDIRRGNTSKLRHHLGSPVPSDRVAPRVDGDEGGSRIDAEVYGNRSKAPIPTEHLSTKEKMGKDEKDANMVKSYSCRWLREKKGRRWAEDNYDTIIQSLREL